MEMRRALAAAAAVAVALAACPAPARAADGVVKITGRISGTGRSQPTAASAESYLTLGVGETGSLALFVNDFDGAIGSGGWPIPDWSGEHAWHVTVRAVSVFADSATLDVEWRRYDRKSGSGAAENDTQRLTLRQGQHVVLDVARSTSRDSQLVNAVVEIQAAYVGDPDFENSFIAEDIWLVHERGGETARRHLRFTAKPGDARSFAFEPVSFTPIVGDSAELQLLVEGEIRAAIRPDGRLDVELKANRTLDCGSGSVGRGTGVKTMTVKPAETIAVELPVSSGYCTMPLGVTPTGPLPPGLQNADGRVRVDFGEYFRGAKTSILITARRLMVRPAPPREYR